MSVFGIFHKNKRRISFRTHRKLFVAMFLFVILGITGAVTFIFNVLAANDVPVPSVEISSQHSNFANNEPGSWKITKSAKWTDFGKAKVTFNVETIAKYNNVKKLDVLMVIDNSGSMSGDKMEQVKSDAADLTESLLSDPDNRMALVVFSSTANILSGFINDKTSMTNFINNIGIMGSTNYNQGLIKALEVLDGYEKQDDRELILLFLTDGFPNEETMNEVAQYQTIKTLYPYATVNGIQYEMGEEILEPIIRVSDNQYIANMDSLNNILFEATIVPYAYDDFVITDFIDNEYWTLSDANNDGIINTVDAIQDISATIGRYGEEITYNFPNAGTGEQIEWNLSGILRSGKTATLTINLDLKGDYINSLDDYLLLPTNTHETIVSSIENVPDEDIDSDLTPILKSNYTVTYEANAPANCDVSGIIPAAMKHTVLTMVEIHNNELSCSGYTFKGWKIATPGVSYINDDYFRMPEKDVLIKAIWTKPSISKSLEGTAHIKATATFDTGRNVNAKMKSLSKESYSAAAYEDYDDAIVSMKKADTLSATVITNDDIYILSSPDSMVPIYGWFDNGTFYYYTDAEIINLNANAGYMFYRMRSLSDIDLSEWNTANTTNMGLMFYETGYNAPTIDIDLTNWNTANVTSMESMFANTGYNAQSFSINLSNWNTSSVKSMNAMFSGTGYNSTTWSIGDLSNWNVSNVTDMTYMFTSAGYSATTWSIGDLSNWDTSKVLRMGSMFAHAGHDAQTFSINLSNWNTSNVRTINNMFQTSGYNAQIYNLDLSNWDISKVDYISGMFAEAGYNATTWSIGDLSNWNVSNVTNMSGMFRSAGYNATTWSIGDISSWNTANVTNMSSVFSSAGYKSQTFNVNTSGWNTSSATNMSSMFAEAGYNATTWSIGDLSSWNVSNATNMGSMFRSAGYNAATWSIGDISSWNTANVTNMNSMFSNAGYSTTNWSIGDLSNWNVSNVTNMKETFAGAGYNSTTWSIGNLSSWNVSNVTNMFRTFSNSGHDATSWSIGDISNWNVSNVTSMSRMFSSAGYKANSWSLGDISNWNTAKVTDMFSVFYGAGHNATNWYIGDLSGWDTASVTDMSYMFREAGYSAQTFNINLSNWSTSNVKTMSYMFAYSGYNATTWSVGDISGWNVPKVTDMSYMFYNTGFYAQTLNINLSNWSVSNTTNMSCMFSSAGYDSQTFTIDLSNWNTSSVTNMTSMFVSSPAGHNATTWAIIIPATNGAGISNTSTKLYGKTTSVSASPENGRSFTLAP